MKITCQSCQAKYTIADEKVVGKTVKIKCKKCGAAIVVNANEAASADAQGRAPGQEPEDEDGATRVFSGDATEMVNAGGGGADWTVNVADDDQRTMSSAQIAAAFAAGTITGDTYVWKDGMTDWLPLSQVAELQSVLSAPRAAAGSAPASSGPVSEDDMNATVAMNPEAAAAQIAAPTGPVAARKAPGRPGQDLFGGGGNQFDGGSSAPPKPAGEKNIGERNENSVLFSLSALTATEKAAAAEDVGPKKKGARSGLDDIMSLGGGGGVAGAPMLAPPPIMAPVIEPPPQQMLSAPPPAMPMGGSIPPPAQATGMISIPPPAPKKSPVGIIVGVVVALVAVGGLVFFLTLGGGDKTADGTTTANSAGATATSQTAAPTTPTAPTPTPTDTVAANTPAGTNPPTPPAGGDPGSTAKTPAGGTGAAPAGGGTTKAGGTAPTAATTAAPAAPSPTATAAAEPPSGGAEFNRAAASSALNAAAGAAKGCKKPDGPTGTAKVKVTFAPSGNVTTSQVQGAPFAGTPVGGCIAAAFRSAKVPPFEGSPVSVTKSVTIN